MGDTLGQDWLDEVRRRINKLSTYDLSIMTLDAAAKAVNLDRSLGMRAIGWKNDYIFVSGEGTFHYYNASTRNERLIEPSLDFHPRQGDEWILVKRFDQPIKPKYPRQIMVRKDDE